MFVVSPGLQPAPCSPSAQKQHIPAGSARLFACVRAWVGAPGRGGKPEITFIMTASLPLFSGTRLTGSFMVLY